YDKERSQPSAFFPRCLEVDGAHDPDAEAVAFIGTFGSATCDGLSATNHTVNSEGRAVPKPVLHTCSLSEMHAPTSKLNLAISSPAAASPLTPMFDEVEGQQKGNYVHIQSQEASGQHFIAEASLTEGGTHFLRAGDNAQSVASEEKALANASYLSHSQASRVGESTNSQTSVVPASTASDHFQSNDFNPLIDFQGPCSIVMQNLTGGNGWYGTAPCLHEMLNDDLNSEASPFSFDWEKENPME
ncbi:unnamed protein product, partial [Protopolystoma xenopodis]